MMYFQKICHKTLFLAARIHTKALLLFNSFHVISKQDIDSENMLLTILMVEKKFNCTIISVSSIKPTKTKSKKRHLFESKIVD